MQGDEDAGIYWIRSGLLKASYLNADGRETIKSFLQAGDVIGSLAAAEEGGHCSYDLICLEASDLIRLEFAILREKAQEDLVLSNQVTDLLLAFARKKERREYELLCLSAEERYRLLQDTMPELARQVTQNDIARYLGITPVALSRIRGRIAGNRL